MKHLRTLKRKRHRSSIRSNVPLNVAESTRFLPWLYFVSGAPALVYQTIWQRLLVLHSGVGAVSISIIVAAYLFGMGVGSLAGGYVARRLSPRQALIGFACVEFAIGVCAIASPMVLYNFLYLQLGWMYTHAWLVTVLHGTALLLPTALMGFTLPLMTRALVRDAHSNSGPVTRLYALNTLGAALGSAIAPWILMPYIGIVGSVGVGAFVNFSIAVVALTLRKRIVGTEDMHVSRGAAAIAKPIRSGRFWLWLILYFLSGSVAIGLEIVWFRTLDVAIKSTAFTFGTVLSIYLMCMALGSLASGKLVKKLDDALGFFLLLQCAVLVASALPILLLIHGPGSWWPVQWLITYWLENSPFFPSLGELRTSLVLYALLPLGVVGPAAFLMGFSFGVLQLGVQCDARSTSVRVGWLQSANIAGCTMGSLVVGLVLLGQVGSAASLQILMLSGFVFAILGAVITKLRTTFLAAIVLLVACVLLVPNNSTYWKRFHGRAASDSIEIVEDITGVAALSLEPDVPIWRLSANGKGQSRLPYGGVHSKLGALPATLHPDPKHVAIVGLGSGNTAWAAACNSAVAEIVVFEILTAEHRLLTQNHLRGKWPQLDRVLADARVILSGQDGRHALMTSDRQYDIIEADAIRPNGSYAGYLYSIEFFRLCSQRLRTGGYVCTWSPTPSTYWTFCEVFPHVLELDGGSTLIGSNQPIIFDPPKWKATLQSPAIADYLGSEILVDCLGCIDRAVTVSPQRGERWLNTDLFPFDEFRPFE